MSDDDDDTFFVIILPVTIVIFISIFTYLFVGYMRLKKHLLKSGQVISAVPFLILPDEQPEIRSPDGELPPPAYNAVIDTEYENINTNNTTNNNNYGAVNYNHPSLTNFTLNPNNATGRRVRNRTRSHTHHVNPNNPPVSGRGGGGGGGGMLISQAEMQQSGPPSTEMMLERPPPVYSIECTTEVPQISNERSGRRTRWKETRNEHIAMNDIAPPPYSPAPEVSAN